MCWLKIQKVADLQKNFSSFFISWFQIPITDAKDNSPFYSCVLGCQAFEQE